MGLEQTGNARAHLARRENRDSYCRHFPSPSPHKPLDPSPYCPPSIKIAELAAGPWTTKKKKTKRACEGYTSDRVNKKKLPTIWRMFFLYKKRKKKEKKPA
jgi:hypothetical protein